MASGRHDQSPYAKIALFAGVVVIFALASVAAIWIRERAEAIARGSLGVAFLYLLFRAYVIPRAPVRLGHGLTVHLPGDLKYVVFAFLIGLNAFWAGQDIAALGFWLLGAAGVIH